jgi:hypothetical protein
MPGEGWEVVGAGAIVEGTDTSEGVPGDVCPQGFTEGFDRAAMSTQVFVNRTLPAEVPLLRYDFPVVGTTPGGLAINGTQTAPTTMDVSKSAYDMDSGLAPIWLRYVKQHDTLRLHQASDLVVSRGYRVTGTPTEFASFFRFPITWQDGQTEVPTGGQVQLGIDLLSEPPDLFEDPVGIDAYGREPYQLTDLIGVSRSLHETIADRILEVRGVNSVPRVESVTLDARTPFTKPWQQAHVIVTMAECSPELPSRYLVRLNNEGRTVWDRMMFAASVRHTITRDEWVAQIGLDVAEWAGTL